MLSTPPDRSLPRLAHESSHVQLDRATPPAERKVIDENAKPEVQPTDLQHTVLLVEPCSTEAWRLRNVLVNSKIDVRLAEDVITAAHSLSLVKPSLILAQLRLPTYGGMELVRRLKADDALRSIPVMLYSDMATAEERIRALELGAVDLISKPFVSAELVARVRAILKARQTLSILERKAHLDGLTGLANRATFDDQLLREWSACKRSMVPLSVVIVDLDHFKAINDTYGHAAGDVVLRVAAKTLADTVRTSDLVARYGGEEFVVIAPNCSLTSAIGLANRFRVRLADQPVSVDGAEIKVTASLGITTSDCTKHTASELLRQADEALYQAKRSGRNAIWNYDIAQQSPSVAVASNTPG